MRNQVLFIEDRKIYPGTANKPLSLKLLPANGEAE